MVSLLQFIAIVVASVLLGTRFGADVGWAAGLFGYALMPFQPLRTIFTRQV